MIRREFLALPALTLACGDEMAKGAIPFGMPPWHMWGNTVQLTTNADINGGFTASRQLLKVAYKRPETWSFFFSARLLSASTPNPQMDVIVLVDVIAGVGRTVFDTEAQGNILDPTYPGFVRFDFLVVPPFNPSTVVTNRKYTTTGSGPELDDNVPAVRPAIEWIPAQDIQVRVRARCSGGAGSLAQVEVSGWFAPRSHVRPEWFLDRTDEQFRGGEQGGT